MKPILLSTLATTLLLVGCGSDSLSGTTETLSTAIEGQLVDSYVKNVDYSCADGSSGVTDIDGRFKCETLPVSFKLGGLKLGEIAALASDKQVFPQDLVGVNRNETNNSKVLAMARFLQSCDNDSEPDNGINIDDSIKDDLEAIDEEFDPFNLDSYIATTAVELVDENSSLAHLEQTTEFTQSVDEADIPKMVKDALLTSSSTLTQEVKDALSYMSNEEKLAYDVYLKLYESFPEIKQFYNIATNAEAAHFEAVGLLIEKYISDNSEFTNLDENLSQHNIEDLEAGVYNIASLQSLYDLLISIGEESPQKALEVGCMVEVTDIYDLDHDIVLSQEANASDVTAVFEYLRNGSYNHYWSFNDALITMGISDGCCSVGQDYCHPEYPQSVQGGGDSNGTQEGDAPRDGTGKQFSKMQK